MPRDLPHRSRGNSPGLTASCGPRKNLGLPRTGGLLTVKPPKCCFTPGNFSKKCPLKRSGKNKRLARKPAGGTYCSISGFFRFSASGLPEKSRSKPGQSQFAGVVPLAISEGAYGNESSTVKRPRTPKHIPSRVASSGNRKVSNREWLGKITSGSK